MAQAIDVLNREALRIVLVVDQDSKLLGTVTDGDIRRSIMNMHNMETVLAKIMNGNPTVASINDNREYVLNIMKKRNVLHIPLLDSEGCLVGLETLQSITERPKYENSVFLMAGGFGKRLRPLTLDKPKPLLKVGSKPILETILEQFIEAGFHNFYISTHYKAEMVRNYFGDGEKWGVSVQYVYEDKPLGTAGALGLLPKDIPDLPIIVMNGDLLTNVNLDHLLQFHNEQDGVATMCVRKYDFQVPFGVVEQKNNIVLEITEKPVHKFFVNAGIYVLEPALAKSVAKDQYIDMPSLLEKKIGQGEQVAAFPIHEYWLDVGRIEEYEQANREALK